MVAWAHSELLLIRIHVHRCENRPQAKWLSLQANESAHVQSSTFDCNSAYESYECVADCRGGRHVSDERTAAFESG